MGGKVRPGTGWVRVFDAAPDSSAWNITTGHGRGAMAMGDNAVWVANGGSRTVARIDLPHLELSAVSRVRGVPVGIAAGEGAVWVVCANGWLWRVWQAASRVEGVARLGRRARALAASQSGVWVLRECGELLRIEQATGEVTLQQRIGRGGRRLIAGPDAIWATTKRGRELVRLDPVNGEVETRARPLHQAISLAADGDVIWVGSRRRSSGRKGWLSRVDGNSLAVEESYELPGQPRAIACGGGAVWVACAHRHSREGTLQRFDPASGTLETHMETHWPVYDLAFLNGSVLATMGLVLSTPYDGGAGYFDLGGGIGGGGEGGGGDGGGGN